MVPVLTPSLVAMDLLCCMGLGFFAAALRVLLPAPSAVGRFVVDAVVAFLALLMAQAYAAQSSNAGTLRFYMVLGVGIGALCFAKVLAPYYLFFAGIAHCIFAFPLRILCHKLVAPTFSVLKKCLIAQKQKISVKNTQKTNRKELQSQAIVLYNSNVELYQLESIQVSEGGSDGGKKTKT